MQIVLLALLQLLPAQPLMCLVCSSVALSDLDSDACLSCGAMPRVPQGFENTCMCLRQCLRGRVCCSKAVFSTFSSSLTLRGYFPSPPPPHPSSSLKMSLIIQLVNFLRINSCKIDQFAALALARIEFLLRAYLGYLRIALLHGLASDLKCGRSKF